MVRKRGVPKSQANKKREEDERTEIAEVLSSLDDLPQTIKKFIDEKVDFTDCDEVLLKSYFTQLRSYFFKMDETVDTTVDEEELKKADKKRFALLKFSTPAFENGDFLSSPIAMGVFGWLNLLLLKPRIEGRVKKLICKFSINHLNATHIDDHLDEGVIVFNYLLDIALSESEAKPAISAAIQSLLSAKQFLFSVNIMSEPMDVLRSKLYDCVTSKHFLASKDGVEWAGLVLSRVEELVRPTQEKIRDSLCNLTKKEVSMVGHIYFNAWHNSDGSIRKEIEEECIQDLMKFIFVTDRTGMSMKIPGQTVFSVLQTIHHLRSLKKFSETVTRLYMPLLWRYLRSSNPLERCNAAQIFFDVFPLEQKGVTENVAFKERQLKEWKDLLVDNCHFVRLIAIKGTCFHLGHSASLLSLNDMKKLYQILAEKIANDGSTYVVREALYNGFASMLDYKEVQPILLEILPSLYEHIHDENEKVRKAFVKMLLKIRTLADCPINYFDIVPVNHIIARLVREEKLVGTELSKLIMSDFYKKNQSIDKTIDRFKKLIKLHPEAPMKLFLYSKNILDVQDAYSIIVTVVGVLRKHVKKHFGDPENADQTESPSVLKETQNVDRERTEDTNNENDQDKAQGALQNSSLLDNHSTVSGMLKAVSVLWTTFSEELHVDTSKLNDLYQLSTLTIPMLLRYYKGSIVYYYVVDFASLVPINKLAPVSTISGACISELKEITEETPRVILEVLVCSLAAWDRGQDLLFLVTEWINDAFRHIDLNETLDQPKKSKVRFKPVEGKPILALTILSHLINNGINFKRILEKRYMHLLELHTFLSKIKAAIVTRLSSGTPFKEPQLSDVFLFVCFQNYLLIACYIHKEDTNFNFNTPDFFCDILGWAQIHIVPHLTNHDEEDSFIVKTCNELLKRCNIVVSLNKISIELMEEYLRFLSALLESVTWPHFVENICRAIDEMVKHSLIYLEEDEWALMKEKLPSLMSKLLKCISVFDSSDHGIKNYINDPSSFNRHFFELLDKIHFKYGESVVFESLYDDYMDSVVKITSREINKDGYANKHKSLEKHPFASQAILKFFLKKYFLYKNLFKYLEKKILLNQTDGLILLSCVSLIYTLTNLFGAKSITRCDADIENCMKVALDVLTKLAVPRVSQVVDFDSFDNSGVPSINFRSVGLKLLKKASDLTSLRFVLPD